MYIRFILVQNFKTKYDCMLPIPKNRKFKFVFL
jgi:hypothetical protein